MLKELPCENKVLSSSSSFQGWPLPLNSKKITVPLLKQLARGLRVSDTDLPDELTDSPDEQLLQEEAVLAVR